MDNATGGGKPDSCLFKTIPEDARSDSSSIPLEPLWYSPLSETENETGVSNSPAPQSRDRRRREVRSDGAKYVETAIFVDSVLSKKYSNTFGRDAEKQLTNFVLAVINEVQTLYKYKSMQSNINIVVKKLQLLKDSDSAPNKHGGEIGLYLDSFGAWQSLLPGRDWDHAIMITGLDLYSGSKSNDQVVGEAWVEGMCVPRYSCTVNEGDNFQAAFVIAHEMGHSFGMVHDGTGNLCNPNKYIMSPSTGAGKTQWSTCSNAALKTFLSTSKSKCLSNSPQRINDLAFERPGLPGERYPLNTQCKLAMGEHFTSYTINKSPFNDPCSVIWCLNPLTGVAYSTNPALEGSSCGSGEKICLEGKCSFPMKAAVSGENYPIAPRMPFLLIPEVPPARIPDVPKIEIMWGPDLETRSSPDGKSHHQKLNTKEDNTDGDNTSNTHGSGSRSLFELTRFQVLSCALTTIVLLHTCRY